MKDRYIFDDRFKFDHQFEFEGFFTDCEIGSKEFFSYICKKLIPLTNNKNAMESLVGDFKYYPEDYTGEYITADAEHNYNQFINLYTLSNYRCWVDKFKNVFSDTSGFIHEGWDLAIKEFSPFWGAGRINFMTFFESHFGWFSNEESMMKYSGVNISMLCKLFPKEKFVGIIHDPFDTSKYIDKIAPYPDEVLEIISNKCLGMYFLSDHEVTKYRSYFISKGIDIPCEKILHPIKKIEKVFDIKSFLSKTERKLTASGIHLRNPFDFAKMITPANYSKRLIPWETRLQTAYSNPGADADGIEKTTPVSTEEYYKLYETDLFFLSTFDCAANNVILDCIDCATPILVKRNPSIEEYLGPKYPLFFDDILDASQLLLSDANLVKAHEYLKTIRQKFLQIGSIYDQIKKTDIYKSI